MKIDHFNRLKHVFLAVAVIPTLDGREGRRRVCLHDQNHLGSLREGQDFGWEKPYPDTASFLRVAMANHMAFVFDGLLQYRLWVSGWTQMGLEMG